MSELMIRAEVSAVQVFREGQMDDLLEKIEQEASSLVPDLSTDKGRKEVASMAHRVARSKTYLDDLGKELVAEQKAAIKLVDGERKRMRDHLDALKVKVRQPLTEWEANEAERKRQHESELDALIALGEATGDSDAILGAIEACEATAMGERWEEYAARAAEVKDRVLVTLKTRLTETLKAEAEAKELERLRAEQAEREAKEREARIAKEKAEREAKIAQEAAAKAEADAQARIEAEQERAEQAKREAAEAEERHAKELAEAEERSKREAEAAVERERAKAEAERLAEAEAQRRRELDAANRKKINDRARKALVKELSIDGALAARIVTLIETGQVPSVTINY